MRLAISWLKDLVDLPPVDQLPKMLAECGIPVEQVGIEDGTAAWLECEVGPNRGDLLSHLGIARELAAASGKRLKSLNFRAVEQGPDVASLARLQVEEPGLCRRFAARVVRNLKVGSSPLWMQQRLLVAGIQPVNNIVDTTQYVMLELGQPLHAYDLARLAPEHGLPQLRVRRANVGERLVTLDGVERLLKNEDLVVADANKPLALAGILGGKESMVTDDTVSILLESAVFDAQCIRQSAKRHRIASEAQYRFERGVDIKMCGRALDRCAALLSEIANGVVAKQTLDHTPKNETDLEISLSLNRIREVLDLQLSNEQVVYLLEPLEIRCIGRTDRALRFSVPSFRNDIASEIDLIEEVARRYGYDKIGAQLPQAGFDATYVPPQMSDAPARARHFFLSHGFHETVTYGLESLPLPLGAWPERQAIEVNNPLTASLHWVRSLLLPGMLQVLGYNARRGSRHARLFQMGQVAAQRSTPASQPYEHFADERSHCAWVMAGGRHQGRWYEKGEKLDFFDISGVVMSLAELLQDYHYGEWQLRMPQTAFAGLLAGQAAEIIYQHECVGFVGQLSQQLMEHFDLSGCQPVWVAEINLQRWMVSLPSPRVVPEKVVPLKYPKIRRDIALNVPQTLSVRELLTFFKQQAGGKLGKDSVDRVDIFDVYTAAALGEGRKSIGLQVDYRAKQRTLTDQEVNQVFYESVQRFCQQFAASVRDGGSGKF